MLRSMTGFGSASGAVDGVEYAVEIRSVNNRYFKPVIRLPESLSGAEVEIERRLRQRISRGSVTVTVRMKVADEQSAHRVNVAALQSYIDQLRAVQIEANPSIRVELGSMLQLPGVCQPPPLEELIASTQEKLMELVDQASEQLLTMRQKEGQALKAELLRHLEVVDHQLKAIAARAPATLAEYQQKLLARVRDLTGELSLDQSSLAREVAIYAERSDIDEEITRLKGHVEQFRAAIGEREPAGRKTDFIAQEMLREANTIASKSGDAMIARAVVEIKTAIDRIKEQVQNAE